MIPPRRLAQCPALRAINDEFGCRQARLEGKYTRAVAAIRACCEHQWGPWEHRAHHTCTGDDVARYERSCRLCGLEVSQDERPHTTESIPETRDSFIDAY